MAGSFEKILTASDVRYKLAVPLKFLVRMEEEIK